MTEGARLLWGQCYVQVLKFSRCARMCSGPKTVCVGAVAMCIASCVDTNPSTQSVQWQGPCCAGHSEDALGAGRDQPFLVGCTASCPACIHLQDRQAMHSFATHMLDYHEMHDGIAVIPMVMMFTSAECNAHLCQMGHNQLPNRL